MITATTFKTRYPEFNTLDDAYVTLIIDEAVLLMDVDSWGSLYDMGLLRLTAHLISSSDASNENLSEKLGELQITKKSSDLDSTIYGEEFKKLAKRVSGGVAIC